MSKSPGHHRWPNHKVLEQPVKESVQVEIEGDLIANSSDVIRVVEDDHPARYYFPRSDVKMKQMKRTATMTECPFKGTAHYFDLNLASHTLNDAVWSYENPYDEHQALKDRIAYDDQKFPQIHIRTNLT